MLFLRGFSNIYEMIYNAGEEMQENHNKDSIIKRLIHENELLKNKISRIQAVLKNVSKLFGVNSITFKSDI